MSTIAFIGLGIMGSSMALNVRAAGHDLAVYDIRREAAAPHLAAGAKWADSPRAVAETAEVVFTSLPGPREVEAVALGNDGLLGSMRSGAVWFDPITGRAVGLHVRGPDHVGGGDQFAIATLMTSINEAFQITIP